MLSPSTLVIAYHGPGGHRYINYALRPLLLWQMDASRFLWR